MTGVPLQDVKSPVLNVLGDQTLTYLGGALTGQLGKTVARGLGLETLRIDTGLVSPQQSPEARITIGQHLARDLQLIFSQGLRDSNNRIIILNFEPLRNFNFQALHQQSDVYRFSFQNQLHFGPSTLGSLPLEYLIAQKPLEIGRVELSGDLGFPEKTVRKRLSLKEGKRFDFFSYRKDVQKLRDLYRKSGHLQAAIRAARETDGGRINISFGIQAGPRVEIHSQGLRIPRSLQETLERAWMQDSDDRIRLDDVQRKTEAYLCSKRYFRAEVAARVGSESQTGRRVLITVNAGNRFSRPALIFSGNNSLSGSRLTKALDPKTICSDVFIAPQNSSRTLRDFYRQSGYLQARVERPVTSYGGDGNSVSVTFKIEEGPLFSIRSIAFEGNQSIDSSALLKASGLRTGEIFLPEKFDRSQSNLQSFYEAKGFNRVDIEAGIRLDQANSGLAVDYKITENSRAAISDIQISGNRMTGSGFIRDVLSFRKGDLVTFRGLNESRRDLYNLGVFQTVNIDAVPSEGSASQADPARNEESTPLPYVAKIDVAESKPVTLRYGLQYDTETMFGGNAELVHHNLFRRAVALGGSTNLDRLEQAGRAFIQTQHFLGKADTQFFVYFDRRVEPAFDVDVRGLTLQQQRKIGERSILSYDYSFERNRSLAPSGPLNQAFNIGRLTLALINDSRDDVFDPRKGHFISQTLEYGARFLGSEVRYLRYFGQSFFYFRLTPFLLYATGLRLGLGQGLGRDLLPGQRFFAGGSNTIRGFDFHEIGPKDPATGEAVGGNALFVLNEELRFPIYDVVSGAAFLDLGQVYPSVSRFNPFRVRSAAGFGLRLSLGALLGRFDLGFKLNRRTGESPYRVYFSIGQAF